MWSEQLGLWLGAWFGAFQGKENRYLRFFLWQPLSPGVARIAARLESGVGIETLSAGAREAIRRVVDWVGF